MEHPEPLTKSVEYLQNMDDTHYLYMLNNKNPIPLLELAKNNGFQCLSHEDDKGLWHILIAKKACDLSEFLDV